MRDLILCLDLASIAGWALFTLDGHLHSSGVWESKSGPHDGDRWASFRAQLCSLLARYSDRIAGIALERPVLYGSPGRDWISGRVLFGQSAIVELEAAKWMIPSIMIPPSEIKEIVTGNGNAKKDLVVRAIETQLGPLSIRPGGSSKAERERRAKARSDEADARGVGLVVLAKYCRRSLRARKFVELGHAA